MKKQKLCFQGEKNRECNKKIQQRRGLIKGIKKEKIQINLNLEPNTDFDYSDKFIEPMPF
mgnify:CR=1 FL=1